MEHLVVLLAAPVRLLEQRPHEVEQADRERPSGRRVELGRAGRLGHDGLLSVDDARYVVKDALEADGSCLDPRAVAGQPAATFGCVAPIVDPPVTEESRGQI